MPALIIFGASGGTVGDNGSGKRPDQLKVKEDAQAVVEKLGNSENGFADLSPGNKPRDKVWVNRDQVRMVRSA